MENQTNIIHQLINEIQYLKKQDYLNSLKIDELQNIVNFLYYQKEDSNKDIPNKVHRLANIKKIQDDQKETVLKKKIVKTIKCKWFNKGYC